MNKDLIEEIKYLQKKAAYVEHLEKQLQEYNTIKHSLLYNFGQDSKCKYSKIINDENQSLSSMMVQVYYYFIKKIMYLENKNNENDTNRII